MKISLNDAIAILFAIFALAGYIWKFAELKSELNSKITRVASDLSSKMAEDKTTLMFQIDSVKDTMLLQVMTVKDNLTEKIHSIDKRVEIYITSENGEKILYEYKVSALDGKIEHKVNRLKYWLDQVVGFLQKDGFQVRDDKY